MKKEVLSLTDFLHPPEGKEITTKLNRHLKKYGFIYKIAGVTVVILIAGGGLDYGFATSGLIDREAKRLYYELASIGKWIIAFKGALDVIKSVGNGDFENAKKATISHVIIFLLLLGIPFGLDKVDELYHRVTKG